MWSVWRQLHEAGDDKAVAELPFRSPSFPMGVSNYIWNGPHSKDSARQEVFSLLFCCPLETWAASLPTQQMEVTCQHPWSFPAERGPRSVFQECLSPSPAVRHFNRGEDTPGRTASKTLGVVSQSAGMWEGSVWHREIRLVEGPQWGETQWGETSELHWGVDERTWPGGHCGKNRKFTR